MGFVVFLYTEWRRNYGTVDYVMVINGNHYEAKELLYAKPTALCY